MNLTTSVVKLQRQLCDMTLELETLQQKLRAGRPDVLGNSSRLISDIRQWLKIALEAEADLEKRKRNEARGAAHDTLDLEAARLSTSSRLDRLRRARSTNGLSE